MRRESLALLVVLTLAACQAREAAPPNYRTGVPTPALAPAAAASPAYETAGVVQFRFQVGDELATSVWREPDLATQQRILGDGTISPPLLKALPVVGLSVDDVRERLERGYSEFLKEPKVSVRVVAIHSDRVFVIGEVKNPQAVPLVGPTTLVQAIAQAGGFTEESAEKGAVRVIRADASGRAVATAINVKAVLVGAAGDVALQRGDIVFVPARGVTEWARTVGQALSPISTAIGTAGSAAITYQALK